MASLASPPVVSAIQTFDLTKIYKGKKKKTIQALKSLNLKVDQGTTFGFVGPNGAGKTTTIKILCGLGFQTGGQAVLMGKPSFLPEARKSIGYLSEVASYSPYFVADELLLAFGKLQGLSFVEAQEKSEKLLKSVGLYERKKSRLGEFSKGMLQRFGIAQALLHDPSILILDEPTSGLDPIGRQEVLQVLHDLKKTGLTLFFSSHQLIEVEGLCDYVGIIDLGDLIFRGTLAELEAQETESPFLIRFKPSDNRKIVFDFPLLFQRNLDNHVEEIGVERTLLDKTLNGIHSSGGEVVAVFPQKFPLEEIFVKMISKHGRTNSA
jgi:ABC-2 type transport system ATP-binding protein